MKKTSIKHTYNKKKTSAFYKTNAKISIKSHYYNYHTNNNRNRRKKEVFFVISNFRSEQKFPKLTKQKKNHHSLN